MTTAIIIFCLISMGCEVLATEMICQFGLHMSVDLASWVGILVMIPLQLFTAVLFDYLHRIQTLLEKD